MALSQTGTELESGYRFILGSKSNSRKCSNFQPVYVLEVIVMAKSPSMDMTGSRLNLSGFWLIMCRAAGVPMEDQAKDQSRSLSQKELLSVNTRNSAGKNSIFLIEEYLAVSNF